MSLESFEPMTLFVSVVTSLVGWALFRYGRKETRPPQMIGGLLLMVYPYFVSTVNSMLMIAAAILAGMWFALRAGW